MTRNPLGEGEYAPLFTTVVEPGGSAPEARSGSGEDTAAVFLHGLMGRGKNFAATAQALQRRSILVDAPNHGRSPWTTAFSYQQMVDLTAATLRELTAEPVHLVGHSMGGKTAMLLALEHPELVKTLTVVDIAPTQRGSQSVFRRLIGALAALPVDTISSRAQADELLREMVPENTVRAFLLQNLVRGDHGFEFEPNIELLLASLDDIVGFPEVSGKSYEGPTLWVAGGDSNYVQDGDLPVMEQLFPDTVPVSVAGSGHWVHSEKPREFQQLLSDFLAE